MAKVKESPQAHEKDRVERDSLGEMRVPRTAYYGAQTARALENFPVSGQRFGREFIRALGLIKYAAAVVNQELGLLEEWRAEAIQQAAQEVIDGKLDAQFVVDIFQTGSGTSTNMNANEVIANRAIELLRGTMGSKDPIHPNDHVNLCQSSNDVIPAAIHLSARLALEEQLIPALQDLRAALARKAEEWDGIVKTGRTHLQDATPIRLSQEASGWESQVAHGHRRLELAQEHLSELAIGGTAVGTGINAHPEFGRRMAAKLSELTGLQFIETPNHFEAQAAQDAAVELSGQLKTLAVSLMKIANDTRWLGSGPRAGLGELIIPAVQPGSSIMPGKINPVIAESLTMVCAQVMGNDVTITIAGQSGNFELNLMLPLIVKNLLESITLLANATRMFTEKCVEGLVADRERCEKTVESNLALATALVPRLGYDLAAKIAQQAWQEQKTIRQVVLEQGLLSEAEVTTLLDPRRLTEPLDVVGSGG